MRVQLAKRLGYGILDKGFLFMFLLLIIVNKIFNNLMIKIDIDARQ
jgi:hypothetical protein